MSAGLKRTVGLLAILIGVTVSAFISCEKVEQNRIHSPLASASGRESWAAQAGLTKVQGPGIIIELSERKPGFGENIHLFRFYDSDLMHLVNELWANQCEAISINDERIGPRSAIRSDGTTIIVNNAPLTAPFLIKALGNPADLENALRTPWGWVGTFERQLRAGCQVTISRSSRLELPAIPGNHNFKYATPSPE